MASINFFARFLSVPGSTVLHVKLVPVGPERPAVKLLYRTRGARALRATLIPPSDEDPLQATCKEGKGGDWESTTLVLQRRKMLERATGSGRDPSRSASLHIDDATAFERGQSSIRRGSEQFVFLEVEYCLIRLSTTLARLPELELLRPLARPLHSYAHGGFMGAALSLLSDPRWATVLLDTMGDEDAAKLQRHVTELSALYERGDTAARKDQLPLMLALENSPVLCAYGLVRSGSTKPLRGDTAGTSAGGAAAGEDQGLSPPPYVWQTFGLPDSALPYMLQPFVSTQLHPLLPFGKGDGSAVLNRYGYSPIGLEWDLWLSPDSPADLAAAVVDHGSAGDLVQQAIAMALRCKGVAKSMGRRHNEKAGISPMRWLADFAKSVNQGVMGDEGVPLPLYDSTTGQPYSNGGDGCSSGAQTFLRLTVESLHLVLPAESSWLPGMLQADTRPSCRVRVVGNTHTHSPVQLRSEDFVASSVGEGGSNGSPRAAAAAAAAAAATAAGGMNGGGGSPAAAAAAGGMSGGASPSQGGRWAAYTFSGAKAEEAHAKEPGAAAAGPGAGKRRYSVYPVEAADLASSLLVVEVLSSERIIARAVVPLCELAARPSGAATFTAPLAKRVPSGGGGGGAFPKALTGLAESATALSMHITNVATALNASSQCADGTAADAEADLVRPPSQTEQGAAAGAGRISPDVTSRPRSKSRLGPGPVAEGVSDVQGSWRRATSLASAAAAAQRRARSGAGDVEEGVPMRLDLAAIARMEAARVAAARRAREARSASMARASSDELAYSGYSDATMPAAAADSDEEDAEFEVEEAGGVGRMGAVMRLRATDEDAAEGAQQEPADAASIVLAEGGTVRSVAIIGLRWERLTVIEAAQQHHNLPPHVAQTCAAMLSAPGGLFLDIKSGYSTAPQLRAFASTLQGMGIHVKAICSFVPKQIAFEESATPPTPSATLASSPSPSKRTNPWTSPSSRQTPRPSSASLTPHGDSPPPPPPLPPLPPSQPSAHALLRSVLKTPDIKLPRGRLPGPARRTFDTVLFFHGLNGLELACEAGRVPPGTCVLFNGASMLLENANAAAVPRVISIQGSKLAIDAQLHLHLDRVPQLVDREAWRRYCTVVTIFKVFGGIYVQEPDCCPAAVEALIELTNTHTGYLPLGFAYGHLGSKAVAAAGHTGRGMAAQQLMEELQSRKAVGKQVEKWIDDSVHVGASDQVYLSWGRRLLTGQGLLYPRGQRLLLRLLADYERGEDASEQGKHLRRLVSRMGGFNFIFLRFFQHFTVSNWVALDVALTPNHTKPLLHLLRTRGVLEAMPVEEKAQTAKWLVTDKALTVWQNRLGRKGRHHLVKEALCCLIESATPREFKAICTALGGYANLRLALVGWLFLNGWTYYHRVKVVKEHWQHHETPYFYVLNAQAHAREHSGDGAGAAEDDVERGSGGGGPKGEPVVRVEAGEAAEAAHVRDPMHVAKKGLGQRMWLMLKNGCLLVLSLLVHVFMLIVTCGAYALCCVPALKASVTSARRK